MTLRNTISSGAIAVLIAGSAVAQMSSSNMVQVEGSTILSNLSMDVESANGLPVYSMQGDEIGQISAVIGETPTTADAMVVDFNDESGRYGTETLVVPVDQFDREGERVVLEADASSIPLWSVYEQ